MSRKDIQKAIKIVWSSLDSHLNKETDFDRQCVKEYSFVIKVLSDLLKGRKSKKKNE